MMTCDEIARVWPERWPRPDAEYTQNCGRMVKKFGADFAYRDPETITLEEAQEWCLANLPSARYVRTMFNDLVASKVIAASVFGDVKLPTRGEEPVVVPKIEQIEVLVVQARELELHWLASMIVFSAFVGTRFGETRAILRPGEQGLGNPLTHTELDGCGGIVLSRGQIDWQLARNGKLKRPKTKRGVRPILVPSRAREAVEEAHRHHDGRSAFLWNGSRKRHTDRWGELRREVRIWFKWHDLRHHAATWLLDHGATADDVAKQLGCKVEEVRDRYGHPDAEKALGRLEGLVDG